MDLQLLEDRIACVRAKPREESTIVLPQGVRQPGEYEFTIVAAGPDAGIEVGRNILLAGRGQVATWDGQEILFVRRPDVLAIVLNP